MGVEIFEKVLDARSGGEKAKILENFWLNEKNSRTDEENIEIVKRGVGLLENGTDREKICALQIISRAGGFSYPDDFFRELEEAIPKRVEKTRERKTLSYEYFLDLQDKCFKLILHENGNVRIAAAHCLNHLRGYLEEFGYVELFYNLLSLLNFSEEKDKKKVKSIEFCLDKIWSPYLEELIEKFTPLAVKKMKITFDGKETDVSRELENFSNSMIKETEKYISKILKLRGERMFVDELVPYVVNSEVFQVSYECDKIMDLVDKKKIDSGLLGMYLKMRLGVLIDKLLEGMEKIPCREGAICVLIDEKSNDVKIDNLQAVYNGFLEMKSDIESGFLVSVLEQG